MRLQEFFGRIAFFAHRKQSGNRCWRSTKINRLRTSALLEEIIDAWVAKRRFQTFLLLVLAAIAVALAPTRYVQSLLFQVHATDWRTWAAAIALLAAAGALASPVPAMRGAGADSIVAPRHE